MTSRAIRHLERIADLQLRAEQPGHAPAERLVVVAVLEVVEMEQSSFLARTGERLIGSSECLESLIGKGKRLEGQKSKSGFTKTQLAMAAGVKRATAES